METSLVVMEEMLAARGFMLVNLGYPSTEATVEELFDRLSDPSPAVGAQQAA